MPLSLDGTTGISASGNITAAFILGNISQATGISSSRIVNGTSEANIGSSGGNANISIGGTSNVAVFSSSGLTITGDLSVTGNASLTGNIIGDRITNGTTSVEIQTSGGNANISVGGTSNVAVFATTGQYITGLISASGNITSAANLTGGNVLATTTVSAASHIGATVSITGTMTAASTVGGVITGSSVSVTGNVTGAGAAITGNVSGGNVLATTTVSAASHIGATVSITGTMTAASTVGGVITGSSTSVTGTVTGATALVSGGTISTAGNIVSTAANATANIGSATTYFNTVHAKATSAQYADVAEKYLADKNYAAGTVLEFGGNQEVTETTVSHSWRVAGVVSTNPAYIMNAGANGNSVVEVALLGRVPCRVVGPVVKGDRMVSSDIPGVAQTLDTEQYQPGCVIGKALTDWNQPGIGIIEVVVGKV
jgi:hypothetical protein